VNNVKLFSHELVSGHQYVHRQQTIDTTVPLPHGVQTEVITFPRICFDLRATVYAHQRKTSLVALTH